MRVCRDLIRDLRSPRSLDGDDAAAAYQEHLLAEFVLARMAHGRVDATIRSDLASVVEFLESAEAWVWEIEERHADRFLGEDQRHLRQAKRRCKALSIDAFFRFVELRYRGEILELTGQVVSTPIDEVNRPTTAATSRSVSRPRRRRWRRSSPAGGGSWPSSASG